MKKSLKNLRKQNNAESQTFQLRISISLNADVSAIAGEETRKIMQQDLFEFLRKNRGKKFTAKELAYHLKKNKQGVGIGVSKLFEYDLIERELVLNKDRHWEYRCWMA